MHTAMVHSISVPNECRLYFAGLSVPNLSKVQQWTEWNQRNGTHERKSEDAADHDSNRECKPWGVLRLRPDTNSPLNFLGPVWGNTYHGAKTPHSNGLHTKTPNNKHGCFLRNVFVYISPDR